MNTLPKHGRTLLVVVTEAAIERRVVQDARERGALGWTVTEVRGGSARGVREGAWEVDRTVEVKFICEPAVADAIAGHLLATYAPHYGLAMYFTAVEVIRPERF
jgi:nitrogen regulatory protein P-II 2